MMKRLLCIVVLLVLFAVPVMAATSADANLSVVINALLPVVLPAVGSFLIGWLLKSPMGKKLPAPVAMFLRDLDPDELDDYVRMVGTTSGRRELVTDKIKSVMADIAARNNVAVTDTQLSKWSKIIVSHLESYYKAGVVFASRKLKK